jgi:hypothetical protein
MECYRNSCPSGRFSYLHKGTLELCLSDHRVLSHLPDQCLSPPIAQFGRVARSMEESCDSKLLHLRMIEAPVISGTFNAAYMFWYTFPVLCLDSILSRSSYVCVCMYPIQLIEFTTGGLQVCRNLKDDQWKHDDLSSRSSLVAKGLNTYVNKIFFCFKKIHFLTCFRFVVYGVLCVDIWD